MSSYELSQVYGGYVNLNSSLINAITKLLIEVVELGRNLGSSLRRKKEKNYC